MAPVETRIADESERGEHCTAQHQEDRRTVVVAVGLQHDSAENKESGKREQ